MIRSSCRAEIDEVSHLASIFQSLEYHQTSPDELPEELLKTGKSFGMLDDEIRAGIDELVGLLMRRASESGRRIVCHKDIHQAFTGCGTPHALLSPESLRIRRDKVKRYQHDETTGQPTIPREVSADIAQSILVNPVTVVIGDGGTGKTVAACEAVAIGLTELNTPPGFGLILRASDSHPEAITREIDRWRNHAYRDGSLDWQRSMKRLRAAFDGNPLLVICIDAIDEKPSGARLSSESQQFIRELIDAAVTERDGYGMPIISIVLTCRGIEELNHLSCSGFPFKPPVHEIDVSRFDNVEIASFVADVDSDVRQRISKHLDTVDLEVDRMHSRSARFVAPIALEMIRHPLMWRFFSTLDVPRQHACLDGNAGGLDPLAQQCLDWFCRKAERRIGGLLRDECITILEAVAQRFRDDPARIGDTEHDWLAPCIAAGCVKLHAKQIHGEALTSGILIEAEKAGRRWRWRHQWFCEYLWRTGGE